MEEGLILWVFFYLVYFVLASILLSVIFLGIYFVRSLKSKKTLKIRTILILCAVVYLMPFTIYIPVEYNTMVYGGMFRNLVRQSTTFINIPVIYYKVMTVQNDKVKLFVVYGDNGKHLLGQYYEAVKTDGKWKLNNGDTVWSNMGGSASEYSMPPYW